MARDNDEAKWHPRIYCYEAINGQFCCETDWSRDAFYKHCRLPTDIEWDNFKKGVLTKK